MKKIKEHNLYNKKEDIIIRSIKNSDLNIFKDWFINDFYGEKNTYDEINNIRTLSMYSVMKLNLILIIEIHEKPIGYIMIGKEKASNIMKNFKGPYYNKGINLHEKHNNINKIIEYFLISLKIFKIKKGVIYILFNENNMNNYYEYFINNGFENIEKNKFFNIIKLKKKYIKMNLSSESEDDYLYGKYKLLIKEI